MATNDEIRKNAEKEYMGITTMFKARHDFEDFMMNAARTDQAQRDRERFEEMFRAWAGKYYARVLKSADIDEFLEALKSRHLNDNDKKD